MENIFTSHHFKCKYLRNICCIIFKMTKTFIKFRYLYRYCFQMSIHYSYGLYVNTRMTTTCSAYLTYNTSKKRDQNRITACVLGGRTKKIGERGR